MEPPASCCDRRLMWEAPFSHFPPYLSLLFPMGRRRKQQSQCTVVEVLMMPKVLCALFLKFALPPISSSLWWKFQNKIGTEPLTQ